MLSMDVILKNGNCFEDIFFFVFPKTCTSLKGTPFSISKNMPYSPILIYISHSHPYPLSPSRFATSPPCISTTSPIIPHSPSAFPIYNSIHITVGKGGQTNPLKKYFTDLESSAPLLNFRNPKIAKSITTNVP